MKNQFSRTQIIIGKTALETLKNKTVAVFGIGGVGGYVCESLVRSGVGKLVLVDNDDVAVSNINRQIIATNSTIGQSKVDVMANRAKDINPDVIIEKRKCFYLPETATEFNFKEYDYVVDAIDTVTAKIDIIMKCKENNIPIISAMGAGNKMEPSKLEVSDISKTEYDPLAKVMRRELRKRGINHLKVVYSKEKALNPFEDGYLEECLSEASNKRVIPGSTAFVPSAMGLIIASEVIKDLIGFKSESTIYKK